MPPVINPNFIPTVAPGGLFTTLTTDQTLNIRWITAQDPVFYSSANRPTSDIVVRQLIIAKSLDLLTVRLGHGNLYPFLIQPRIANGSSVAIVPTTLFWDVNFSLPTKWNQLRLAKIKRMSGTNHGLAGSSGGTAPSPTGVIRFMFTASKLNNTAEIYIFEADYQIDSPLTYQIVPCSVVSTGEESSAINQGENQTVFGYVVFRTGLLTDVDYLNFLETAAPPGDTTVGGDGFFVNPAVYEILDSVPGDPAGDFDSVPVGHGTGMILNSAWQPIPQLSSDIQSWIDAFNYPFDSTANLTASNGIIIPTGLFREFNMVAPAGDQPTNDTTGLFYPVWITRVERVDATGNTLRVYFATHNVTDPSSGGDPSLAPVEFATLDLSRDGVPGDQIDIASIGNLLLQDGTDAALFTQEFGRGHVVLSSVWDGSTTVIQDFFNAFEQIAESPADALFSQTSTRISSFGLSRAPRFSPTQGQSQAMTGTSARRLTPLNPSINNRFVTELDQGQGDQVDLEAQPGITPNPAIQRYGFNGSICHHSVILVVDSTKVPASDPTFYNDNILPRLRVLLGRDPVVFDTWFNGTRMLVYTGDSWVG